MQATKNFLKTIKPLNNEERFFIKTELLKGRKLKNLLTCVNAQRELKALKATRNK